ncbi:hypothetical protein DFP72DRAFT_1079691 [Ephemerocybe angulata]|uniref:Uncharacterized protein n=1 Tax=Ephemerocybe angulata TaxID=980116 RepID=A0A8H6LWE0_9AGAR|nr:hypothetical protein DFP72DRAFT_1079691 [Tulosesus angulatus]
MRVPNLGALSITGGKPQTQPAPFREGNFRSSRTHAVYSRDSNEAHRMMLAAGDRCTASIRLRVTLAAANERLKFDLHHRAIPFSNVRRLQNRSLQHSKSQSAHRRQQQDGKLTTSRTPEPAHSTGNDVTETIDFQPDPEQ